MLASRGHRGDAVPRRVFVFWQGGPLSATRAASLEAIRRHVGVETVFLTGDSLHDWVVADAPLHPAFGWLSAVHQADYVRCYLMHHHGGGYVDLKPVADDWRPAFDRLDATPIAFAAGYQEVGPGGVGTLGMEFLPAPRIMHATWWRRRWLQLNYWRLIGTCAFIFRPGSPFTAAWFTGMTRRLDGFAAGLAAHPARYPRDHAGAVFDGQPGGYPVPWTALLADVFHPLALHHHRRMLKVLPAPAFENYQ